MQILQWLLKKAAQEPPKMVSKSTTKNCDEGENIVVLVDGSGKRRHVKGVEKSKLNCENLLLFRFIQRKDVSKPFFYHTLNLKGLGSLGRMKKKAKESGDLGGNKVLPIAESSRNGISEVDDKTKKCRKMRSSVSRVKELLKWSAAAKSLKKGVASMDGDEYESPKISFRWEMVGCSSTMITAVLKDEGVEDNASGIGNWITTDSEFVVLEL